MVEQYFFSQANLNKNSESLESVSGKDIQVLQMEKA